MCTIWYFIFTKSFPMLDLHFFINTRECFQERKWQHIPRLQLQFFLYYFFKFCINFLGVTLVNRIITLILNSLFFLLKFLFQLLIQQLLLRIYQNSSLASGTWKAKATEFLPLVPVLSLLGKFSQDFLTNRATSVLVFPELFICSSHSAFISPYLG